VQKLLLPNILKFVVITAAIASWTEFIQFL
jgi:hypothetical protein